MNPEELLAQIQELIAQYTESGGDPAIIAEMLAGGAPPEGGMPPEAGGEEMPPMADEMPMMSGDTPVPDMAGMAPEEGVEPPMDLRAASMMAEEDMKKRMGSKGR